MAFETKDYFTLVMSAGALIISALNFFLAQKRDRRELEAKTPLIDIEAPDCDGIGPWTFCVTITNRDAGAIEILRFISDERRIVDLGYGEPFAVSLANMSDPQKLNFATINRRVAIGEKLSFTVRASGYRGKRVGSDVEAIFILEYRSTLGNTKVQRRRQPLIINP